MPKLTDAERDELLPTLPEWNHDAGRDAITRTFRFADFNAALGFMTRVALLAEKTDHHPEWSNVWNRVEILLITHYANGINRREIALATAQHAMVARRRDGEGKKGAGREEL